MTIPHAQRKIQTCSLTLGDRVLGELDRRGDNRSAIVRRDSLRFYNAMAVCGDFLCDYFSAIEWAILLSVIPEVSADALLSLQGWKLVEQQIIRQEVHKRYKGDPKAVINKLAALDRLNVLALIDAVERWNYAATQEKPAQVNPFKAKELSA